MKSAAFLRKFGVLSFAEKCWAGGVFFLTYVLYIFTLYPTVASEDAGEFSTAVATLGVAHPPGYPLYILMGKIFTFFIPFGNVAWKVNLFSAFCGAVAAVLLYFCLKLFTRHDVLSFFGAVMFAVGGIFWSQSVRAEVYTLNTLLFLLILFVFFLWFEKRHQVGIHESNKLLFLGAFLFGLSLGNHYLMFLAGPPLFVFVFSAAPELFKSLKFWLYCSGFFVLGLSVYLYLPVSASMHPVLNWGDPSTWDNFWNHVTRKFYSSTAVDASMQLTSPVQKQGPELFSGWWFDDMMHYHVWQMFLYVVGHVADDYFWGLFIFVPAGFWWFWKKSRAYGVLFASLSVFYSFVLAKLLALGYADRLPVDLFKDRPFYIPILLIVIFLSVIGIYAVTQKFFEVHKKAKALNISVVILGFITLVLIVIHFPQQNQSGNYVAHDLAALALNILPRDSVYVIENSDNTFFPVLYLNVVEGLRKDVTYYVPSPIFVYNFYKGLDDAEAQHSGKRIFTDFPFTQNPGRSYNYLGPVSEIVYDHDLDLEKSMLSTLENVRIRGLDAQNLDHFNAYLSARFLLDLGLAYGQIDDQKQRGFFEKALQVAPDSVNVFSQLIGNYYVRRSMFEHALPFLQKAQEFYPKEYAINFQLFLSYLFTHKIDQALPVFSFLYGDYKKIFLSDYEQVKQVFIDHKQDFLHFEQMVSK